MKYCIMRIPEPSPLGDTFFRAIVLAICSALPVKVLAGVYVETVVTPAAQRLLVDFPDCRFFIFVI